MYAKFMNLSFQTRLMIFFIISALVPLIVLGVFTYQKSSELSKEQVSSLPVDGSFSSCPALSTTSFVSTF